MSTKQRTGNVAPTPIERRMAALAYVAYLDCHERHPTRLARCLRRGLDRHVKGQRIVWGPAVHVPPLGVEPDAMMFVVETAGSPGEITVVVRGTNPLSLVTWLTQDASILAQRHWLEVSPGSDAPLAAKVSHGACRTLELLTKLVSGESCLLEFLEGELADLGPDATVRFTGHSLGGLAAPTLALWVREQLHATPAIEVYSFAGPSAGNARFVEFSTRQLPAPAGACACYRNELDFASSAWEKTALAATNERYHEAGKLDLPAPFAEVVLKIAGELGYTRLGAERRLDATFTRDLSGLAEVAWQHVVPYAARYMGAKAATAILVEILEGLVGAERTGDDHRRLAGELREKLARSAVKA
jgi:hypothetical protein